MDRKKRLWGFLFVSAAIIFGVIALVINVMRVREPTTVQWRKLVVSNSLTAMAMHGLEQCGMNPAYVADEFEKLRRRYKLSEVRDKQLDDTFAAASEDAVYRTRPQTREGCANFPATVDNIISRMREVQ